MLTLIHSLLPKHAIHQYKMKTANEYSDIMWNWIKQEQFFFPSLAPCPCKAPLMTYKTVNTRLVSLYSNQDSPLSESRALPGRGRPLGGSCVRDHQPLRDLPSLLPLPVGASSTSGSPTSCAYVLTWFVLFNHMVCRRAFLSFFQAKASRYIRYINIDLCGRLFLLSFWTLFFS